MDKYKQLLILRLSNLTEWKSEAEMIIPKEMRRDYYWFETCELIGDGKYILRYYWSNGNKHWEAYYQNDQRHGKYICWKQNGDRYREEEWSNGHQNNIVIICIKEKLK